MNVNWVGISGQVGVALLISFISSSVFMILSTLASRTVTPEEMDPSVEPQFLSAWSRLKHVLYTTNQTLAVFTVINTICIIIGVLVVQLVRQKPKSNTPNVLVINR